MEERFGNLFDYLAWRGDLTFRQSRFNAVDALILSIFSYSNYPDFGEKIKFRDAVQALSQQSPEERFKSLSTMWDNCQLFSDQAAHSRRFRNLLMTDYVVSFSEQREKQFAAVTFHLPDGTVFLSFRGTDNTLVGWKEDINMSFTNGIPAQLEAAEYAESIARKYGQRMRLGGHSKGGNLAVWAAAHLSPESKKLLLQVYSNDGPGFVKDFIESEDYHSIQERILAFVPEASIVGVLMSHCDYLTIKSTNLSIMQHDPFSWEIIGTHFLYETTRPEHVKQLEKSINGMIASMSPEQMESFSERIYDLLSADNSKTVNDLRKNPIQHLTVTVPKVIKEVTELIKNVT